MKTAAAFVVVLLAIASLHIICESRNIDEENLVLNNDVEDDQDASRFLAPSPFDVQTNCDSTGPICEGDCTELLNGQYQYCGNCSTFLVCSSGVNYYGSCPGELKWDDVMKACTEVSDTCQECYIEPRCVLTGPACITDCTGLADNDYQLCENCTSYAMCSGGALDHVEHCPVGLYFDDKVPKGCAEVSTTCIECFDTAFCNTTGPACVVDCTQLNDGRYQTCHNCVSFAICTSGQMEYEYCPLGMYYDDNRRGCFQTSDTCHHCALPDMCDNTGSGCVSRCGGMEDGFYQACTNCTSYVRCSEEYIYYESCVPADWLWDSASNACLPASYSCEECIIL